MMTPPVLLAAGAGWVEAVIVLFMIGGWVVSQLVNASKSANPSPPVRPAPRPESRPDSRPTPPPRAGSQRDSRETSTNDEIAEFLRRAKERRGDRGPADVEVASPAPYRQTETPTPRSHRSVEPVVEAEVLTQGTLAEHVAAHMAPGRVSDHASHLTDEISQTDERLAERLHRKFDHRLGSLDQDDLMASDPSPEPQSASSDPSAGSLIGSAPLSAAGLNQLLRTANGMRTAIILGEIVERPEHRWS